MIGDRKTTNILTDIKDTGLNIENIKSTQLFGGKSFVTYTTQSTNQYDFSIVVPQSYKRAILSFTYSAKAADKYHMLVPTVYYRLDNPAVMDDPIFGNYAVNTEIETWMYLSNPGISQWVLQFTNAEVATHTFYCKAFFSGTVDGTFAIFAF